MEDQNGILIMLPDLHLRKPRENMHVWNEMDLVPFDWVNGKSDATVNHLVFVASNLAILKD